MSKGTLTGRWLMEMFERMSAHFGPCNWWPADSPLEMMAGAVLTQNTNWQNVEKALENLKKARWLSLQTLHRLTERELAGAIRPAGYYNIKAGRLKNLVRFIVERYGTDLSAFLEEDTETLREGLLSVKGIGPETADSILLYAAGRPVFVVDAYTHRILARHEMAEEQSTYHELQSLFMDHLPPDPGLFNEFHALIVRVGKTYCRKKADCGRCPLGRWGPASPLAE
ncbi:MAG: endonuclease III domain-containing protein [Deltaproteobacteria bacterium]|nr:endonuclease III domain-containing protein [Deltaproteobacteria bacterium]MBW1922504.1 endonuclease III domain-containing protein [Deltaproteobacteria bacterium]MBW1948311.1 endonuclease III domain-containing protein [Deltaproteobacteria bacterium]MBW2006596.1 endonuclease III domain-containing protein [Deltaproteobacteria bacterium]MBW2102294.1 endonuclease III domain-containing protein [Deltaproteobacteria bacterium]